MSSIRVGRSFTVLWPCNLTGVVAAADTHLGLLALHVFLDVGAGVVVEAQGAQGHVGILDGSGLARSRVLLAFPKGYGLEHYRSALKSVGLTTTLTPFESVYSLAPQCL